MTKPHPSVKVTTPAEKSGSPVVIITGASRGIGRACALLFAARGYDVVINYIHSADKANEVGALVESAGQRALVVQGDMSVEKDIRNMYKVTRETFGRLDSVIVNAGITDDGLIAVMSREKWTNVIDTNLTGAFLVSREAVKGMRKSGGSIVMLSSTAGLRGQPGTGNYAAAKGALISFTQVLAKESAPLGIRVNAVAPGLTTTDMTGRVSASIKKMLHEVIPMARAAHPDEIAQAIQFLASPDASYITGQILAVDGGLTS